MFVQRCLKQLFDWLLLYSWKKKKLNLLSVVTRSCSDYPSVVRRHTVAAVVEIKEPEIVHVLTECEHHPVLSVPRLTPLKSPTEWDLFCDHQWTTVKTAFTISPPVTTLWSWYKNTKSKRVNKSVSD